jgi:hypothetical protein
MCATQIAAINGGEVSTLQPLSQGFSLCDTSDAEGAIEMPLDSALLIPYGFTVAKKNDTASGHWSYFKIDGEIIL